MTIDTVRRYRRFMLAGGAIVLLILAALAAQLVSGIDRQTRLHEQMTVARALNGMSLSENPDGLVRARQRFDLPDLVLQDDPPDQRDLARVALVAANGTERGWLVWTPQRPGMRLLGGIALPLVGVLAVLGWVGWLALRALSGLTRDLSASRTRTSHVASHDPLTGLPNRALMFERLRTMLGDGPGARLAIHALDLNGVKGVNDTLGHHAGDALIRAAADMLVEECGKDALVARLDGDDFVLLQDGATVHSATDLADRVLARLARPFVLEEGTVEIGGAIGVAMVAGGDASRALRQADLALHAARGQERGGIIFFEPAMEAALRLKRGLENDLRRALATGGLSMVYQTQVDDVGDVLGVEALVRWHHPERGAIMPVVFVPLAEESGLIHALGDHILDRVFAETRHWTGLSVAINMSALQLRSPGFMARIEGMIAHHRINPARYDLEITETALLGEDKMTRANLLRLADLGFTITLDDFGTGYSSLANLRRFAVDKIKIDRSFVAHIDTDREAEALVEAIVRLGHALKLEIVAEGVETESQRQRLIQCGCRQFQGWLFSRPVPAVDLEQTLIA